MRVSYDGVVSVDWADDGTVEDVILQGEGGLDEITVQITNLHLGNLISDHTNCFCGEILVSFI